MQHEKKSDARCFFILCSMFLKVIKHEFLFDVARDFFSCSMKLFCIEVIAVKAQAKR